MKTLTITGLLVLASLAGINAQKSFLSDWHLGVSYYGNNLWNPGLQVTGQKVLAERTRTKEKKSGKVRTKHQQFILDANLGAYYDNPTYWALFNNYQVQYRRVRAKGKYASLGFGPGVLRTFLPETYEVDPQGQVSTVRNSGVAYFAPVIALGTGRLWKRRGTNPWRLQLHFTVLTNYNVGVNALVNVEYGYIFGYKSKEDEN